MDATLEKLRSIDLGKIPGGKLLVPIDREFLEWQNSHPEATNARSIVEDNPILNAYLNVKHISRLGPDTKIPLGILILCHNMYLPDNRTPRIQDLEEVGDARITSRFPFGILLGTDIRKTVLKTLKKHLV